MRPSPLPCLLLLSLLATPARAENDDEVLLSSVLSRTHDRSEPDLLRRMLSAAERRRFDRDGVPGQMQLLLRRLGITTTVTCSEEVPSGPPGTPLGAYRCDVVCQHGAYAAHLRLGPPAPADRPAGTIERVWLASPVLDQAPAGGLATQALLLLLLCGAPLLLCAYAVQRLRLVDRRSDHPLPGEPEPDRQRAFFRRSLRDGVLALRLLSAAGLAALLPWLLYRMGPLPQWGRGPMLLGCLGLLGLGLGLGLLALAAHRSPASRLLPGALTAGVTGLLCLLALALALPVRDDDGAALSQRQDGYLLPLPASQGPVYVRRSAPLDLVYLHPDGQSCHGPAPQSCRGFGLTVLAPADGEVAFVDDRAQDHPAAERDRDAPTGNYVILRHGAEYCVLSHLQHRSALVRPGQVVRAGQPVARLGNSGDSDQPHLELEIWPALQPLPPTRAGLEQAGLPVSLQGYQVQGLLGRRDAEGPPEPGQLITPR